MTNTADTMRPALELRRVRHELKLRIARVKRVQRLNAAMVRITFEGPDLQSFESASFDDHVKVMFPPPGAPTPWLPTVRPDGPSFPNGIRPLMRDYTPRRSDRAAGELDIDFVIHDAGPATSWAAAAQLGDTLAIGGPRGSTIIPMEFDWHLLIGDESALPAIGRRLEELPAGTPVRVIAEIADASAALTWPSAAAVGVTWCERGTGAAGEALLAALHAMPPLPHGEGFAWAAAESAVARRVRAYLCGERALPRNRVKAAAYWKDGAAAVHEVIDD